MRTLPAESLVRSQASYLEEPEEGGARTRVAVSWDLKMGRLTKCYGLLQPDNFLSHSLASAGFELELFH